MIWQEALDINALCGPLVYLALKKVSVFDKVKPDWDHELYQIKLSPIFWMKGWELECPYNPRDLVVNLEVLSLYMEEDPEASC